jgi:hypothetical protein
MTTERRARTSLTRTDLNTSSGLELLGILQSIADDGTLTREESEQLRSWLTQNASAELAASEHLKMVIDEILKDGVVTDEELALLHDAVLRVLPTDLRSIATLRRRERKSAARQETRARKEEERDRERAERERNRPIGRADFMVAGATRGAERREACESCSEGDVVTLEREPDNHADRNAIVVQDASGEVLGYVPRDLAQDFAPLLDGGAKQSFTIKKCIETSSGYTIPVVWGALYRSDSTAAELESPTPPLASNGTSGNRASDPPTPPTAGDVPMSPAGSISPAPSTGSSPFARSSPTSGRRVLVGALLLVGSVWLAAAWLAALLRWAGIL